MPYGLYCTDKTSNKWKRCLVSVRCVLRPPTPEGGEEGGGGKNEDR